MSSNYPPGVTGREDVFGPQAERTMSKDCDNEEWWPVLLGDDAAGWVQHVANLVEHGADADKIAANVAKMKEAIDGCQRVTDNDEAVQCEFSGDVDVQIWSGSMTWTCPRCGKEHDDEFEDEGPDPDDERDRMLEERVYGE
jgi:hypothetical protein